MSDTQVIDTATELAAIAESADSPPSSNSQSQGDAANAPTDAAEQDVDTFLSAGKEGEQGDGTEASGETGETSDSDQGELPELKEAREAAAQAERERVSREEREKYQREQADRQQREAQEQAQRQFEQNYRQRMQDAENLSQELQDIGVEQSEANRIAKKMADNFNSHHADGKKLYQPEVRREVGAAYNQLLNDSIKEALGDQAETFFGTTDQPKNYSDLTEALKAFKDIATEGRLTRAEAESEKRQAVLAYRRDLESKGLINGASSGRNTYEGSASTGRPDDYPLKSDGTIDTERALASINATAGSN